MVIFAQQHIIEGIKRGDPAAWVFLGGAVALILGTIYVFGRNRR